ncbi:hypothetical protein KY290_018590 [Solanum tuberosum]|uniref:Uncharacterized protein n=1 Tax=Solanum tuberosum TaxID=4113 RepID=A0ABQ7VGT8_SOLTU|nr:hypothetical protein KY290_018590 [Solanum tuberosum]
MEIQEQASVSLSSAKAEYRSMRRVVSEITWLTRLLTDLGATPSVPIPLHSDSLAAIHIARNLIFHERTKHVEIDCHFVRQQFLSGLISLQFVPSSSQLADLFTKPLSGPSHHSILGKLGLASLLSNLKGGVGIEIGKVDTDQQTTMEQEITNQTLAAMELHNQMKIRNKHNQLFDSQIVYISSGPRDGSFTTFRSSNIKF